ncbi:hypothetical protein C2S52_018583 [Perilla frutescens var. hirtella]|nr:hypothetical protein C2S52_018583 [Perilla frutescens var. hirtella]
MKKMDNQPRNRRLIVKKFDLSEKELPPRKRLLTNAIIPSQETEVGDRNYGTNREETDNSFEDEGVRGEITLGVNISSDQDSKIAKIDEVEDQKRKEEVADEVPPVQNDSRKVRLFGVNVEVDASNDGLAIQESQDHDDGERRENRENVISSERNTHPLFHRGIHEDIQLHGGIEPPFFLFEKKLDLEDVRCCFNRLYLSTYSQLLCGLTRSEREKLYNRIMMNKDASLRVVTKDPMGFDYEMQVGSDGVCVLGHEWSRLVTANGLQEGDKVEAWGYCLGDEFRLALIFVIQSNLEKLAEAAAVAMD